MKILFSYFAKFIFLNLFLFCLVNSKAQSNQDIPNPSGAVNDFASVIDYEIESYMESVAKEVLRKTNTSVVIMTINSIGNKTPETYANMVYENWGIGKKGEDKGVLILMALSDRKVRIETGYGVEGILPDGLVGSILREKAVPLLKGDHYGAGLLNCMCGVVEVIAQDAGVEIKCANPVIKEIEQLPNASTRTVNRRQGEIIKYIVFAFLALPLVFFIFIGVVFVLRAEIYVDRNRCGRMFAGGFGGGGFKGGFGGSFKGGFGGGLSGGGGATVDF